VHETAAREHERDRARVTKRLEEACTNDRWSVAERTCVSAADDVAAMTACRRAWPAVDSRTPLVRTANLRCETVGPHVAGLMRDQLASLAPENIAAAVLVDAGDLPAQVTAACTGEQWSEQQRRCYAAATRFANIVACNQRSGGA
jgi:hypothetical protein